jgi:S-adenosylmethionine hydrolase
MKPNGIVTLCTDFGTRDAYVGIMKGVLLSIAPALRLVDLTHEVPPQSVEIGALVLRNAVEFFPRGTVHLAVVDPGVGSARAALLAVTENGFLVGPDNGLLHPAATAMGLREVRRLERPEFFRRPVSRTFHGRDVFAPVAAHVARGVEPRRFGPTCEMEPLHLSSPVREGGSIQARVIYVDHFGNLVTNVDAADLGTFPSQQVSASVDEVTVSPLVASYAAADPGAPLLVLGSWGLLEVAVRDGNAAEVLRAGVGTPVVVRLDQPASS